jgi:hypothetical protein
MAAARPAPPEVVSLLDDDDDDSEYHDLQMPEGTPKSKQHAMGNLPNTTSNTILT